MSGGQFVPKDKVKLFGVDRAQTCRKKGAEVFEANSVAVVVKPIKNLRRKIKNILLRFKKLDDCSVADIIPETSSLTARGVIKLLEEVGLTPSEIESFVEWAHGIGLRPDKCYAAAAF